MEDIKTDKNLKKDKDIKHWVKVTTVFVLKLILTFIVAKLSWNCNHNTNIILRILITCISCMFSEIYILYYAFYRFI